MFNWESKTELDKVIFFDNFYQNINVEVVVSDELSSFLENIFKTSSDIFLRTQALRNICELTVSKHITNPFKALALLFEINQNDDEFLIALAIKYLFLFYLQGQSQLEIQTAISKFQNHHCAEITSEANFRLGLIKLNCIQSDANTLDALRKINDAERSFKAATFEVENRVDADFFLHFTALYSAVCKNNNELFDSAYNDLKKTISEKQLYSLEKGDIELEFSISKLIDYIKCSYESVRRSNIWHYPIKELSVLSTAFLELESCEIVNSSYQLFHHHVKTGIVRSCLNTAYLNGLGNKMAILESIKSSTEGTISEDFIVYVLSLLQSKNESITTDSQFVLAIREVLGNPQDAEEALKQLGGSRDILSILDVLGDFFTRTRNGLAYFETGYFAGDDILSSIREQVAEKVPDLDLEKKMIFFDVLAQVIRYAYHSHLGYDKSKFFFLFSKKVSGGLGTDAEESHLQNSLFESLKHTSIAEYFEYEKGKVASGGRVDIIFQCDKMRIPIEVKKTDESPTVESVEKYYIAQAQTYASAYEQLGIFVLLDLSDKEKNPISNFKDWFNIHHLSPATNLPVNHPDYIVSVVIPGNKLLPSMMSTYK